MKMYFLLNMGIFQCHLSFQGCTLSQPVDNRYCQGDEMLKNFAAEPHLDKENKARFLWPKNAKINAGPFFFFVCVFRMSKLPKEHNFSGAFLGPVALFFCFTHTCTTWKGSLPLVYHGPLPSYLLGVASHLLSLPCAYGI